MSTYLGRPDYFINKEYANMNTQKRKLDFDGSSKNYLMRNNGFTVGFNMPNALSGERTFALPPYAKRMPYLVDKYPACPKDWLRSEGIVKSFFVPVIEDKGMWLDFNENENNAHHVAIVISVQGINPITGMPCEDAQLEQYIEKCPKHNVNFGPDRYCSKCDYKWPKQNYISTTATPSGFLWLDGFRTIDGVVRQYILTAEKIKGVASNIIGKNRVYAIGLSFFISKEKKPKTPTEYITPATGSAYYTSTGGSCSFFSPVHTPVNWQIPRSTAGWRCRVADSSDSIGISDSSDSMGVYKTQERTLSLSSDADIVSGNSDVKAHTVRAKAHTVRSVQVQKLEVGAGSNIQQSIYDDPEKLDFWYDKPESIICINYASESDVCKILEQGEVNIEGHKEGFLKKIKVGN